MMMPMHAALVPCRGFHQCIARREVKLLLLIGSLINGLVSEMYEMMLLWLCIVVSFFLSSI